MACGCGSNGGSAAERYEVRPADGTAIKRFVVKAEADVYAARTGGFVKDLAATK